MEANETKKNKKSRQTRKKSLQTKLDLSSHSAAPKLAHDRDFQCTPKRAQITEQTTTMQQQQSPTFTRASVVQQKHQCALVRLDGEDLKTRLMRRSASAQALDKKNINRNAPIFVVHRSEPQQPLKQLAILPEEYWLARTLSKSRSELHLPPIPAIRQIPHSRDRTPPFLFTRNKTPPSKLSPTVSVALGRDVNQNSSSTLPEPRSITASSTHDLIPSQSTLTHNNTCALDVCMHPSTDDSKDAPNQLPTSSAHGPKASKQSSPITPHRRVPAVLDRANKAKLISSNLQTSSADTCGHIALDRSHGVYVDATSVAAVSTAAASYTAAAAATATTTTTRTALSATQLQQQNKRAVVELSRSNRAASGLMAKLSNSLATEALRKFEIDLPAREQVVDKPWRIPYHLSPPLSRSVLPLVTAKTSRSDLLASLDARGPSGAPNYLNRDFLAREKTSAILANQKSSKQKT